MINTINKQQGIVQIIVTIVMLFMAVALPLTVSLVKKNQENRSKATAPAGIGGCIPSVTCNSNGRTLEVLNSNCSILQGIDCPYGCNSETKACNKTPTPCSNLGARQCSVNYVQFCTANGWVDTIRCGGGAKTWGSGGFTGSCNPGTNACDSYPAACVAGETLCQGAPAKHYVCNRAENGWGSPTDCPSGECNLEYTDCASATPTSATPTSATPTGKGLNFKIAFAGLKPDAFCVNNFTKVKVTLTNRLTGVSESRDDVLINGFSSSSTGSTNSKGDLVFAVTLDKNQATPFNFTNFGTSSDNVLRVKGYLHAQMKYCTNGQKAKTVGDSPCNISLTSGIVYDFSNYSILAGDVNVDGVINSSDFSYIKSRMALTPKACGKEGDLTGDGYVNYLDLGLVKDALIQREDE